jgi:hypothetical protein
LGGTGGSRHAMQRGFSSYVTQLAAIFDISCISVEALDGWPAPVKLRLCGKKTALSEEDCR